jgi:hypothetical protein
MNIFDNTFRLLMEDLNPEQKHITDRYARERNKTLSFGPMFKEERTYFPLENSTLETLETPKELFDILDKNDLYCPDYRQGYVYKKDDKEFKSKQRLIPALNKIFKQKSQDPEYSKVMLDKLTKDFNERLKTSRKENIKCLICITHNPYDVAGMSTDRSWTSCMNLNDGRYKETALKQVQYGRNVCIFN